MRLRINQWGMKVATAIPAVKTKTTLRRTRMMTMNLRARRQMTMYRALKTFGKLKKKSKKVTRKLSRMKNYQKL